MHVPRKFKAVLAVALGMAGLAAVAIWTLHPAIETRLVSAHQRSVTRSLARWSQEDSNITNDASAIHAAEMVGYVSSYYVPGEGYRGPVEVEAALERQRQQTIRELAAALERYTGLAYGTNVERWAKWAEGRKGSEQNGPANRSQPVRHETNSTPLPAGSGR